MSEKKWLIRHKGEIDYPTPSCGCECFNCRKAHYMYHHENALNEEYISLLDQEKKATSETIIAVEAMERDHTEQLALLNFSLMKESSRVVKLTEELEFERKLRLSEVYTRQSDAHESVVIEQENSKLIATCMLLQDDFEKVKRENEKFREENIIHQSSKLELIAKLKNYEYEIFKLEMSNADLRSRLSSRS